MRDFGGGGRVITAMALAFTVQATHFVEVPDRHANSIRIEALVKLPAIGPHRLALVNLIAETIFEDTQDYGRQEIRNFTLGSGEPLQATVMPDHIRIEMSVAPSDLKEGIAILANLIRSSRFPEAALNQALQSLPYRNPSFWSLALNSAKADYSHPKREEVTELYARLFRPENLWISISGRFKPGDAIDYWQQKTADWLPPRLPPDRPETKPITYEDRSKSAVSTIGFYGRPFPGDDAGFPTRLLAVYALGVGKGSSVFQAIREKNGWSYRQEAFLWPTAGGFVPRVLVAMKARDDEAVLAEKMRSELVTAVQGWTDADLKRAVAMARQVLIGNLDLSPLYVTSSPGQIDSPFLAAYWPMKTGSPWQPDRLIEQMKLVRLGDLQDAAKEMLADMQTHIIHGG